MFTSTPTITIVGFGAFGQLAARYLAPHARISVLDPARTAHEAARGLGFDVLEGPSEVRADIVLLAVPVPALAGCLQRMAPHLGPGQMVVDVCSVKEEPARLMRTLLPESVDILATHPMFGPQSARDDLSGRQVVLCPVRSHRWRRVAAFLKCRLGLDIVVTTPEDHDRQAAMTQGLTHLLARALASLGDQPRIRTQSYSLMAEALAMVAGDAPEVFEAVTRGNRHVEPLARALTLSLSELGGAAPGK
ncbi:prephenate dehydrogenase/arogenate dehydrogenase family protein [Pseudooceanicola sp. LIPI14-2-Ac024]|uniref:prephenate dehydrogenase/arogenate dehydrogenase family protein n=1 Tax=Pseudooceanicola sp. LIPI14-2-Ac024 TaxID=3344875 RepID=UPI0035D00925